MLRILCPCLSGEAAGEGEEPLLGKGAGLASAAPRSLPPPGAAGVLGGTTAEEARARFGLLQLFNEAVSTMFRFVFTGCALCPIAPIAPCTNCPFRQP